MAIITAWSGRVAWPEDWSRLAIDQDSHQSRIASRDWMARGFKRTSHRSGQPTEQDGQQRAGWPAESRIASREQDGQQIAGLPAEQDGQQNSMASKTGWPGENRTARREQDGQQSKLAFGEQNVQQSRMASREQNRQQSRMASRAGWPAEQDGQQSWMAFGEQNGQQRAE